MKARLWRFLTGWDWKAYGVDAIATALITGAAFLVKLVSG